MLKEDQINYLKTVPQNRKACVFKFDPDSQITAEALISEVKKHLPDAQVYYIGSSALGIDGENDIDLTFLAGDKYTDSLDKLKKIFGNPTKLSHNTNYAKWEFTRDSFPVELHLGAFMTPGFQEQLDTQKILEANPDLRLEYERLKWAANGLSWKEYLKRKYEFWNRILGIK